MKRRLLSVLLSLCLMLGLLPTAAFAQGEVYVALGDSISTGYGLTDSDASFTRQIAASKSYALKSHAVDGATSSTLLAKLSDPAVAADVASADVITITIGGNDLMGALYLYLANQYNKTNGTALSAADIQNALMGKHETIEQTIILIFASSVLSDFPQSAEASSALQQLGTNLTASIAAIKNANPDVTLIVANQYNPYSYAAKNVNPLFAAAVNTIVEAFETGITALNATIATMSLQLGYDVADVSSAFKSAEENPCNASFASLPINPDFHPNAYGHSLIANAILPLLPDTDPEVPPAEDALYVNGQNILTAPGYTVPCGNGAAIYNPETNTLVLVNAQITESYSFMDMETLSTAGIFAAEEITIILEGTSYISNADYAVFGESNVTMQGSGILYTDNYICCDGSMTIACGLDVKNTKEGPAIRADGDLTFAGTSMVNVTSSNRGIYSNAGITIQNGAALHVVSTAEGITCLGSLTIEGGEVAIESEGTGIYNALNSESPLIINGGNITVTSKNESAVFTGSMAIHGGNVNLAGKGLGLLISEALTITGGNITVTGGSLGINLFGKMIMESGSVTVNALDEGSYGIRGRSLTVTGGTLNVSGQQAALLLYSVLTVSSSLLPLGHSVQKVSCTYLDEDQISITEYAYTIAEDGADLSYENITGSSWHPVFVLTGAPTNVVLRNYAPENPDVPSTGSGTTTDTVTNPDGSTTTTVTKPDGSSTITTTAPNGASSVATVDKNGSTSVSVKLPETTITNAQGKTISLPMPALSVTSNRAAAPVVTMDLPDGASAKVEIPVTNATTGTVAILVRANGTEEIVKTSVATQNGVVLTVSDGDTIKVVDNSKSFSDVSSTYWGADAVDFVTSRELFNGTSSSTFSPNSAMDRAMIVTVLARFAGVDTSTGSTWYEAGVQWAKSTGISDGSDLTGSVTREQLATMLYRYAQSQGLGFTGTWAFSLDYADADQVSEYAYEAMCWMTMNGIFDGVGDNMLDPAGTATRAQVATILMRFIENFAQ